MKSLNIFLKVASINGRKFEACFIYVDGKIVKVVDKNKLVITIVDWKDAVVKQMLEEINHIDSRFPNAEKHRDEIISGYRAEYAPLIKVANALDRVYSKIINEIQEIV